MVYPLAELLCKPVPTKKKVRGDGLAEGIGSAAEYVSQECRSIQQPALGAACRSRLNQKSVEVNSRKDKGAGPGSQGETF